MADRELQPYILFTPTADQHAMDPIKDKNRPWITVGWQAREWGGYDSFNNEDEAKLLRAIHKGSGRMDDLAAEFGGKERVRKILARIRQDGFMIEYSRSHRFYFIPKWRREDLEATIELHKQMAEEDGYEWGDDA